MTPRAQAIADCNAQLAQIEARIAECLAARKVVRAQASYRLNEERLHRLYTLQYDVQQDLARCTAAAGRVA